MKRLALALALLLAAASAAAQSTDRYRPNTNLPPVKRSVPGSISTAQRYTLGHLEKGEQAPDFELALAGGGKVKLSSLRGRWAVVCFCARRDGIEALVGLDTLAREVPEHVTVLAVLQEKVSTLTSWAARNPTKALLLEDATGDIAALYGAFDLARSEPTSAYAIVDPKGVVQRIVVGERVPPGEIARAVQYAVTGL
jgi:peroxiredoxin